MSPRGRMPKDDRERSGHRTAIGQGNAIEQPKIAAEVLAAQPPDDMWPLAAEVWRVVVADMIAIGHLTPAQLAQVRSYAVEVAMALEAEACVAEVGTILKQPVMATVGYGEDGCPIEEVVGWKYQENAAAAAHTRHANAARLMAAELALTPIARIRGNLMKAATASIALGIASDIDAEIDAQDAAHRAARKTPAKKTTRKSGTSSRTKGSGK